MIGAILNALLTQVLNNPELNEYEKLEELALKLSGSSVITHTSSLHIDDHVIP